MLKNILLAYKNKFQNKLNGKVTIGTKNKKGVILLSYLTDPFIQLPSEIISDPHASYWECKEIVRLFNSIGYEVDVINWWNNKFVPKKKYSVCIDVQQNLERLSKYLPMDCKKIMHIVGANSSFQNQAENNRLEELFQRRHVRLKQRRQIKTNHNELVADDLEGFGNDTIHKTYAKSKKEIFPIHESVSKIFDFPKNKDFDKARKNFLWFGGGGAVHKGLDMVLEAFSSMNNYNLHIIGPVLSEEDFANEYKEELSLPNIKVYGRPKLSKEGNLLVNGKPFEEIADLCSGLIYLSCSEGTSGAVVQAMHAGLIPIITPETGINDNSPAIIIEKPTIENIRSVVLDISNKTEEEIRILSLSNWNFARQFYTKEQFTNTYREFINNILKIK